VSLQSQQKPTQRQTTNISSGTDLNETNYDQDQDMNSKLRDNKLRVSIMAEKHKEEGLLLY